ncbi:PEP-CTERM sorting domain-containing protein [Sedimentisphaera salicampi]|uniref:PEP-CTERM sorting domain-containing protein n=1 Tax=Sedimentisphaera salicampi TaxID=1941349 RepID=UPI000B9A30DA|nr:PEP-CTERM sorting domain-containing protein [Sedimentisphaera salicampi]OXU15871.1 hypothetical protein SMSP1_00315 [Sedimentisphaera salicampi]
MCKLLKFLLAIMLLGTLASGKYITVDSDMSDWTGEDIINLGSRDDPDGGSYDLKVTFDEDNIYLGLDRTSTDRNLGDTSWDDDSFFISFDVDASTGSGAGSDGYERVNFTGDNRPDKVFYYAGGPVWYESSNWNSTSSEWNWDGWVENGGTGHSASYGIDGDEFAISRDLVGADIDDEVTMWAWMTREGNGFVETGWGVGSSIYDAENELIYPPDAGNGIMVPEPFTLGLLGIGSIALRRRRKS